MLLPRRLLLPLTLRLQAVVIASVTYTTSTTAFQLHRIIPTPTTRQPTSFVHRPSGTTSTSIGMSATTSKRRKATNKTKTPPNSSDVESRIPHLDEEYVPDWMNVRRTKILTSPDVMVPKQPRCDSSGDEEEEECILYWMQRDMRTVDNWALLLAQHLARERGVPLHVVYTLPPPPPSSSSSSSSESSPHLPPLAYDMPMTQRHATFLLRGLRLVEKELRALNIPLHILKPASRSNVGQCLHEFATTTTTVESSVANKMAALAVVCDFSPLRHVRGWMEDQAAPLLVESAIPLIQVDAHNVVPVWCASPKREVGARTLRPKINKLLPEFLTDFPELKTPADDSNDNQPPIINSPKISWQSCAEYLQVDPTIPPIDEIFRPGAKYAMKRFDAFLEGTNTTTTITTKKNTKATTISEGLKTFDTHRNDPNHQNVCTNMSPWINHGHVSFQRLALRAKAHRKHSNGTAAYLEEGIVRRELSDNFVYYSRENYDDLTTAAVWAQDSLELHRGDEREYLYSLKEFVEGRTHDDLWNAAQLQLVNEGKMHGFLRMYWAKKILEWTESPAIALRTGLYLNDRYALDGNDPNGFVGVGWSMMGIHDMGWKERPIFGKIRFMNYAGCKRKFKVGNFVSKYRGASENAVLAAKKHGGLVSSDTAMGKRKR